MAEIEDTQLANLRAQAEAGASAAAALEQATANIETERAAGVAALTDALRAAHADLPPDAISGATLAEVNASLTHARSIADHVRAAAAAAGATNATAASAASAGQASAPARTIAQAPDNVRGLRRIAFALNNPGRGSTE